LLYLALVCSTTAPSAIYTLSLHDALPIWYKGAQLKKDAERRICAEIRRQLHGVHIRRPVMMRYLWVEPDRRRDRDNITAGRKFRSEEHTSELQSRFDLVCRLLLEKKNKLQ